MAGDVYAEVAVVPVVTAGAVGGAPAVP